MLLESFKLLIGGAFLVLVIGRHQNSIVPDIPRTVELAIAASLAGLLPFRGPER
jgi:drug/metabolite transporter superfamily protein YnfA